MWCVEQVVGLLHMPEWSIAKAAGKATTGSAPPCVTTPNESRSPETRGTPAAEITEPRSPARSPTRFRRLNASVPLPSLRSPTRSRKARPAVWGKLKYKQSVSVRAAGLEPREVQVSHDVKGQHTLSWDVPLTVSPDSQLRQLGIDETVVLPRGSCNLYTYPTIICYGTTTGVPTGKHVARGGELHLLNQLVLSMVRDTNGKELMEVPDEVGAFPIHALMVANTRESLDLSWKLFQARPSLLMQLHVKHRAGFPLFAGESNLHVAAVNNQEELLCLMLELAGTHLSRDELEMLLRSQSHGVFFDEMPARFYGGTALAYACCFELRSAVVRMLETGLVSLNDRRDACVVTGYLPLHAVTANGLKAMYEWLTKVCVLHGTVGLALALLAFMSLPDCILIAHPIPRAPHAPFPWRPPPLPPPPRPPLFPPTSLSPLASRNYQKPFLSSPII